MMSCLYKTQMEYIHTLCDNRLPDTVQGTVGEAMDVGGAARLVRYNVPGDGNCFFHSVAGAFLRSIHMWKEIKSNNGQTLCARIIGSWVDFVKENPSARPETHLNQGFFRFLAKSQITDEHVQLFRATHYPMMKGIEDFQSIPLEQARRDMERTFLQNASYGDEHMFNLLNEYLKGLVRIYIYDAATDNWGWVGDTNQRAFVLLYMRNEHYNVFQFQGAENSFFITREKMASDAPSLLMKLLNIPQEAPEEPEEAGNEEPEEPDVEVIDVVDLTK